MAYTNNPENSTYKTVELPFTATTWARDNDNLSFAGDSCIYNMYFDRNSNENQTREFVLVKRPGISNTGLSLNKNNSTDIVNGYFQDPSTGSIYWSVNNKVYRYNGTTIDLIATMGGTTPVGLNSVGFCLFLRSTGARYLMINNGTELWYHLVTTSSSTQVTDVDYPTPTSPHMVFLDGYLFVVKTGTGDIYNGDLDSVTSWTAGNYITTEINPDLALTLAKVKNYLVCFGTTGIEFFYNAANENGSPLGRNESFYQPVSLQSSVCNIGDVLYFLGRLSNGSTQVFKLDGMNLQSISTTWIERQLVSTLGVGFDYADFNSILLFQLSGNGHNFLGINIQSSYFLVCDLKDFFWYQWAFENGSGANTNRIEMAVKTLVGNQDYVVLGGETEISQLNRSTVSDFGSNFTVRYVTEKFNAGTFNWKTCHRMALLCDYPTLFATSVAQISWSDNDGRTVTGSRDLTITSNNSYITQCGRFRTRNWVIEYTDQYPFRMWGITMDLNVGAT